MIEYFDARNILKKNFVYIHIVTYKCVWEDKKTQFLRKVVIHFSSQQWKLQADQIMNGPHLQCFMGL